jgi:hypothetical protein
MVSFGITVYILPYGVGLFAGAAVLTIAGILPIVPRWFGLIPPGWRKAGHRNHFGLYSLAFMQSSNTCYLLPTLAKVASRWHWYKSRS